MTESIGRTIRRQTWGVKGLLALAGLLVVTVVSPVLSFACSRDDAGVVSCRVTRHALGVLPVWWTTIEPVVDADSEFVGGARVRSNSGRSSYAMSESSIALRPAGAEPLVWTTLSDVGEDGLVIAIDELVAGKRTEPLLAWSANAWTLFLVFIGALPLVAAMLARPCCERRVPPERWPRVIERTYVAALTLGVLFALAVWWGSIPGFIARPLGLPVGYYARG